MIANEHFHFLGLIFKKRTDDNISQLLGECAEHPRRYIDILAVV